MKKPFEAAKVGITFTGLTKSAKSQTELFAIRDVLWDTAPSKGKSPARNNNYTDESSRPNPRRFKTTSAAGHIFLFAIKWPLVNYPPSVPPYRSFVETEYVLRAFVTIKEIDVQYLSEPLVVDFRPRIDPSLIPPSVVDEMRSPTVLKDDHGKVLAEAKLKCERGTGAFFGSDCLFTLTLLVRKSDIKLLPQKAKIDVCEIHKSRETKEIRLFVLSHQTFSFSQDIIKPHQECSVPLRVGIPIPEIDSRRGALGLPTLSIGDLTVEYSLRVRIPVTHSRFKLNSSGKTLVVECPFVVGNAKPKESESKRKVPRLVVNAEGEDSWDSLTSSPRDVSRMRTDVIAEWTDECEAPRFLAGGDVEGDDEIVI